MRALRSTIVTEPLTFWLRQFADTGRIGFAWLARLSFRLMDNSGLRADFDCLHCFVPAREGKPGLEPALVLLHDSGSDETQLLSIGESIALDRGVNVLALRGWCKSETGYSFLECLPEAERRAEFYIEQADRLSAFLREAAREYQIDPGRTVLMGCGDGATMAAALMFVHAESLGGAILYRPQAPFRPRPLPALPGYPVLLLLGRNDLITFEEPAIELAETLFDCGCDVRKIQVPLNHRLTEKVIRAARVWHRKILAMPSEVESLTSS